MPSEVLGVAPWVIIAALVTWFFAYRARSDARQDKAITKREKETDESNALVIHRDELTLQIIRMGREEISAARLEADELREDLKKLRPMEVHFYHFQQSLDHLEALLTAATAEERDASERNARAFLNRMRRLQEAKGTVVNEVQRAVSKERVPKEKK